VERIKQEITAPRTWSVITARPVGIYSRDIHTGVTTTATQHIQRGMNGEIKRENLILTVIC